MAYSLRGKELAFIRAQRVARVATVGEGGEPHNVPVCTAAIGGKLYFASEASARKVRNIRRNPRVALVFDEYDEDWTKLRGLMLVGKATVIEKGATFHRARLALYRKYRQYRKMEPIEEGESVIIAVTPEKSFAWGL
ncbi:MAG: pyridoxamine 5'-phosphate oxidase family protein [Candidatus Binatia bacterium]|nr:pyridoxamine 5'-phosphate oxidase family protein [Candidatus Binatia bacterium]